MRTKLFLIGAAAWLGLSACATAPTQQPQPPVALLDAHTHMMVENISPDEEIARLKAAGVSRVLLMHTEPEVIAAMARKYPDFVIPSLSVARPTVKGVHLDKDTGPLMARLRAERAICGFGEVPAASIGDPDSLRGVYAAAASTGAPLNMHIDLAKPEAVAAVEAAATANPKMHLVLAHLGWTAGPELIGGLLDAHPNLYTDVSIRFDAPGSLPWRNNGVDLSVLAADGSIPPAWRAVITRHPDRFLFAMDINSFGPRYTMMSELVMVARKALAPLPRPVQEAIAHGNAERLLAGCGR